MSAHGPEGEMRVVSASDLPYPSHFDSYISKQISGAEVHEKDFLILRRLPAERLLVIDAGSNLGNSAISCEVTSPSCQIIGFEPNLALRPFLERARKFCGNFEYFPFGLGQVDGPRKLYIPVSDGRHIAGEASLSFDHFFDPIVSNRLRSYSPNKKFSLDVCEFDFRRLDSIDSVRAACRTAKTILFKIDVEGSELEVLRGSEEMIAEHHPFFLIEAGERSSLVNHLARFGYQRYVRTPENHLIVAGDRAPLNSFFGIPKAVVDLGL